MTWRKLLACRVGTHAGARPSKTTGEEDHPLAGVFALLLRAAVVKWLTSSGPLLPPHGDRQALLSPMRSDSHANTSVKKTGLQHVSTPFLPRATQRLQSQATENNAFRNQLHVETPETPRKYPETMPFGAIICHFVKTSYTPSRNRFYFNHFRSWFRTGKHRSTPAPAEAPCNEPCDCFIDRCEEPFRTRVTAGEEESTETVSANT